MTRAITSLEWLPVFYLAVIAIAAQVPNSQIFNGVIENFTLNPLRRVEVFIMTAPTESVPETRAALEVRYGAFTPEATLSSKNL